MASWACSAAPSDTTGVGVAGGEAGRTTTTSAVRMEIPSDSVYAEQALRRRRQSGDRFAKEREEAEQWDALLRLHALQGVAGIPALHGAG
eukprot:825666-Prorocentrum_minimum.AAC.8